MFPAIDTERLNWSPAAPSGAVSFCCSVQLAPARTKTYADPASAPFALSSRMAPTTAVSPESDTQRPNWSSAAPSEAVSFCCTLQAEPART